MGFFFRQSANDGDVVSDVTPASGVVSTDGNISDDSYVAPDLETAISEAEYAMAEAEAKAMEDDKTSSTPTEEKAASEQPTPLETKPSEAEGSTTENNNIDVESIEDGYVNADIVPLPSTEGDMNVFMEKTQFNGIKGTTQEPEYKDVCYSILFVLHFGITIWWYIDSLIPNKNDYNGKYYYKTHFGLVSYVFFTALSGLVLSGVCFGFILRHADTVLKRTIVFALLLSLGLALFNLGEPVMMISGLVTFAVLFIYSSMVWKRTPVSLYL